MILLIAIGSLLLFVTLITTSKLTIAKMVNMISVWKQKRKHKKEWKSNRISKLISEPEDEDYSEYINS